MARSTLFLIAIFAGACSARADVTTKLVEYKHGSTILEGVLFSDSAVTGKRPGVLLAHDLGATSAAAKAKALPLVKLGYIVFSLDLYGKDNAPKNSSDAAAKLRLDERGRPFVRERMAAALSVLEKSPHVDRKRIAAIGYGVGGT